MTRDDVTNSDIFLWALSELGGSTVYRDVEDVYVKCFELAPRRFAWRTKDFPDYKKCAKALRDAEARTPALLVKTGDSFSRQLSVDGQKWIHDNATRLKVALGGARAVPAPKQRPDSRILREVERSDVFARWRDAARVDAEKWEIADLLRCSTDSNIRVWRERIELLRGAAYAAEHSDVLAFLDSLVGQHGPWFGEGDRS